MRGNIKSLLVVICVIALAAVLFVTTTAFTTKSIDVLGKAVTANASSNAEALPKAAEMDDYENTIAAMINNIRAQNGLNALAADGLLNEVAQIRSQDLMDRNYFSHYTPEGTNVFDVMRDNGVSFRYAGENLAQSAPASVGTPEGFINAWMNSPTHMANILRAQYTKIGVSMVEIDSRRIVTTVFTN
ncbi:MAG: CAP domain-containing protein [Candidatus Humimicrobiaceae bacterium]